MLSVQSLETTGDLFIHPCLVHSDASEMCTNPGLARRTMQAAEGASDAARMYLYSFAIEDIITVNRDSEIALR
jgi:hypothetical protein